jgi:hypothetical protein
VERKPLPSLRAEKLAEWKGVTVEEIMTSPWRNGLRLLGWREGMKRLLAGSLLCCC